MNKMLVVVFNNKTNAYKGADALRDLDFNGEITLFAIAVVNRDSNGQVHIEQEADQGPIGTATGMFTGSLIGLLGGPVGLAVGAGLGALSGVAFDIDKDDVNAAFVDEVSSALVKGKTAVLAEIDESWTVPVDTQMEALGGLTFRRLRYEVAEDQLVREAEALPAEYHDMKDELQQAILADKPRISRALTLAESKARVLNDQIRRKEDEAKRELDAKMEKIQEQMRKAGDRRRARLQKRIDEFKADYLLRMDKLKGATKSLHETFGLKEELAQPA
jgi:uncharacterized membrane protein